MSAALSAPPAGLAVGSVELVPPSVRPYVTTLVRSGDGVRLEGHAPDAASVAAAEAAVRSALPGLAVENAVTIARGAPPDHGAQIARAAGILASLDSGRVRLADGAAVVSGAATSPTAYEEALAKARAAGFTSVAVAEIAPPRVADYRTTITSDGRSVVLEGYAPDEASRVAVEDAVKAALPDATVSNRLAIAAGAPENFMNGIESAIAPLADLAEARVEIGRTTTITGAARDPEAYERAVAAAAGMAGAGGRVEIRPATVSDYAFAATLDGDAVRLEGYAPDIAARNRLAAEVAGAVPGPRVDNRLRIAAGAPDGFLKDARRAIANLARLSSGTARVAGQADGRGNEGTVFLKGVARTSQDYQALVKAGEGVASEVAPPATDEPRLSAARRDDRLVLEGTVPDVATYERMARMLRSAAPGLAIENRTTFATGASAALLERAADELARVALLSRGTVSVDESGSAISGEARNVNDYEVLRRAGLAVAPARVEPYGTRLTRTRNGVRLEGYVPSEEARSDLSARTAAAFGGTTDDRLRVAAGAPGDHAARTAQALELLQRLAGGSATIDGTGRLTLVGEARSVGDYEALRAMSGIDVAGVRPAQVDGYRFEVERDAAGVTLDGFVPSVDRRQAVVEAARQRLPGVDVRATLRIAAGAPEDLAAKIEIALDLVSGLESGTVRVGEGRTSVSGRSRSVEDHERLLRAAARTAVDASELEPAIVSPYRFAATRARDTLTLSGYAPDEATRDALLRGAERAVAGGTVRERLRIADGAPRDLTERAGKAFAFLARTDRGTARLVDDRLALAGTLRRPGDYEDLVAAMPDVDLERVEPAPASPYRFAARVTDESVLLEGHAPDLATRDRLSERAAELLPTRSVRNRLVVASGAPGYFGSAAEQALAMLPNLANGSVTLDGDTLKVSGEAADSRGFLLATRAGQGKGGAVPMRIDVRPPRADGPYRTVLERRGRTLILSGAVPGQASRKRLREAARDAVPGARVVNRTVLRSGAPDDLDAQIAKAAPLLGRLSSGTVQLSDGALEVAGEAASVRHYDALTDGSAAPVGLPVASLAVTPAPVSPYTWSLGRGEDGPVLTGFVPSEIARKRIVAAVEQRFDAPVSDEQRIAGGAPEGFVASVEEAVAVAAALEDGQAALVGTRVSLQGRTDSEAKAERARTALAAALPRRYSLRSLVAYPPPEVAPIAGLGPRSAPAAQQAPAIERAPVVAEANQPGATDELPALAETGTGEPADRITIIEAVPVPDVPGVERLPTVPPIGPAIPQDDAPAPEEPPAVASKAPPVVMQVPVPPQISGVPADAESVPADAGSSGESSDPAEIGPPASAGSDGVDAPEMERAQPRPAQTLAEVDPTEPAVPDAPARTEPDDGVAETVRPAEATPPVEPAAGPVTPPAAKEVERPEVPQAAPNVAGAGNAAPAPDVEAAEAPPAPAAPIAPPAEPEAEAGAQLEESKIVGNGEPTEDAAARPADGVAASPAGPDGTVQVARPGDVADAAEPAGPPSPDDEALNVEPPPAAVPANPPATTPDVPPAAPPAATKPEPAEVAVVEPGTVEPATPQAPASQPARSPAPEGSEPVRPESQPDPGGDPNPKPAPVVRAPPPQPGAVVAEAKPPRTDASGDGEAESPGSAPEPAADASVTPAGPDPKDGTSDVASVEPNPAAPISPREEPPVAADGTSDPARRDTAMPAAEAKPAPAEPRPGDRATNAEAAQPDAVPSPPLPVPAAPELATDGTAGETIEPAREAGPTCPAPPNQKRHRLRSRRSNLPSRQKGRPALPRANPSSRRRWRSPNRRRS